MFFVPVAEAADLLSRLTRSRDDAGALVDATRTRLEQAIEDDRAALACAYFDTLTRSPTESASSGSRPSFQPASGMSPR